LPTRPRSGHFQFSTTFVSADGEDVRQPGWKRLDTRLDAVWWNTQSGPLRQYAAGPDMSPTTIGDTHTIVYPLAALGDIRTGTWRADLDVDGVDSGRVDGTLQV
jgi:hypothetical protein